MGMPPWFDDDNKQFCMVLHKKMDYYSRLPDEILLRIADYHEQLVNAAASKIQYCYAAYKGYRCGDCGRPRLKRDLARAHACDCWGGGCWKTVCADGCVYHCPQGHAYHDTCTVMFFNGPDYDSRYCSRIEICKVCGDGVHVHREFRTLFE